MDRPKVYVTIAGRSNALSGLVLIFRLHPSLPTSSNSFGGADIYSSLRMPSGVAPAVVLDAGNTALLALKILAQAVLSLKARSFRPRRIFETVSSTPIRTQQLRPETRSAARNMSGKEASHE